MTQHNQFTLQDILDDFEAMPMRIIRAVANGIMTEWCRPKADGRPGWDCSRKTRAVTPTGNPHNGTGAIGAAIQPPAPRTEVIEKVYFLRGVIDPNEYPTLQLPPIAWELPQLTGVGALAQHANYEDLGKSIEAHAKHNPRSRVFLSTINRHGTPTLRRGPQTMPLTAQAVEILARAATIRILTYEEYRDGLGDGGIVASQVPSIA